MTRRHKLEYALLAALLPALAWGFLIEPGRLRLHHETVRLKDWPAGLEGLTVAAIGDLHAGAPHMSRAKLRTVVERANAAKPDLIVLLGDYVVPSAAIPPEETAVILAGLQARYGVWAVLGNHDWWLDGERVRRALNGKGVRVLENEAVRPPGAGFWVLGLADFWERVPDAQAALKSVKDGAPVIALTHEPDVFPHLPARLTLTLAAHTHGGQVRLPLIGSPMIPSRYGQRYARGLVIEDGRALFVTTGVGTSIIPVRFGVPPEIALLTLRRAP